MFWNRKNSNLNVGVGETFGTEDLWIPCQSIAERRRAIEIIRYAKRKRLPVDHWFFHVSNSDLSSTVDWIRSARDQTPNITVVCCPSLALKLRAMLKSCRVITKDASAGPESNLR